jgi:hypothetical protein
MPLHGNKASELLSYYNQGKYFRNLFKCGNIKSLGTLPTHTNDNYIHFYIGYSDGASKIDHNYGKDYSTCPSGHTQEYCMGYKFGYNNDDMVLSEPDDCPTQGKQ